MERILNNQPGQCKLSATRQGAFNAGATIIGDETLPLMRVAERPIPEEGYVSTVYCDSENPPELKTLRVKLTDPALDSADPRAFTYRGQVYLTSLK